MDSPRRLNDSPTDAMNEWGFIGQDIYVGIGKFATNFKSRRAVHIGRQGYVLDERLVLSNPHSSQLDRLGAFV